MIDDLSRPCLKQNAVHLAASRIDSVEPPPVPAWLCMPTHTSDEGSIGIVDHGCLPERKRDRHGASGNFIQCVGCCASPSPSHAQPADPKRRSVFSCTRGQLPPPTSTGVSFGTLAIGCQPDGAGAEDGAARNSFSHAWQLPHSHSTPTCHVSLPHGFPVPLQRRTGASPMAGEDAAPYSGSHACAVGACSHMSHDVCFTLLSDTVPSWLSRHTQPHVRQRQKSGRGGDEAMRHWHASRSNKNPE